MFQWLRIWRARREMRRIDANFTAAERLRKEAGGYDAARCASLVEDLISRDRSRPWLAFQALYEAGPPSVGPLIAALSDDRFHKAQRRRTHEERRFPRPFHSLIRRRRPLPRVLALLERHQPLPPEAVEPLRRLCAHADDHVREGAGRLLAGMGHLAAGGEYRRRLSGAERREVSNALSELSDALDRGHGSTVVLGLFEDLSALLDRDFPQPLFRNDTEAATLMLRVDRPRALRVLTAPQRLHAEHPGVSGILQALHSSGEVVPPERLLPLLESYWRSEKRHWSLRYALRLAARVDDPACREYIDRAMYAPAYKTRAAAVSAWAEAKGLPRSVIDGHLYPYDDKALPGVVRRWSAAHFFIRWSSNDGFADPIKRRDLLPLALAGMRAAGAAECVSIVERAASLLNEQGAKWDDPRVRDLQEAFYERTDELEVKLILLATDHRDEFARAEAREAAKAAAENERSADGLR